MTFFIATYYEKGISISFYIYFAFKIHKNIIISRILNDKFANRKKPISFFVYIKIKILNNQSTYTAEINYVVRLDYNLCGDPRKFLTDKSIWTYVEG